MATADLEDDYYAILEVSQTATTTTIKASYHRLALEHHPDKNRGERKATEAFQKLVRAWETLRDEVQRSSYDQGYPRIREAHEKAERIRKAGTEAARVKREQRMREEAARQAEARKAKEESELEAREEEELSNLKTSFEAKVEEWPKQKSRLEGYISEATRKIQRYEAELKKSDELDGYGPTLTGPLKNKKLIRKQQERLERNLKREFTTTGLADQKKKVDKWEDALWQGSDEVENLRARYYFLIQKKATTRLQKEAKAKEKIRIEREAAAKRDREAREAWERAQNAKREAEERERAARKRAGDAARAERQRKADEALKEQLRASRKRAEAARAEREREEIEEQMRRDREERSRREIRRDREERDRRKREEQLRQEREEERQRVKAEERARWKAEERERWRAEEREKLREEERRRMRAEEREKEARKARLEQEKRDAQQRARDAESKARQAMADAAKAEAEYDRLYGSDNRNRSRPQNPQNKRYEKPYVESDTDSSSSPEDSSCSHKKFWNKVTAGGKCAKCGRCERSMWECPDCDIQACFHCRNTLRRG